MGLMRQQRLLDVLDKVHILHYPPFDLDSVWKVLGQMKEKPKKIASQSQRGKRPTEAVAGRGERAQTREV